MKQRQLGRSGPMVSAVGLGCMPMSGIYGTSTEDDAIATIHRAIDAGITLFDTADIYGLGENERLLGRAIKGRRDKVVVATKFGGVFDPKRGKTGEINGRPEYVRRACEASLQRLGVETIDLLQQHRVDPATPIEETVGALAELVDEGKVVYVGLSEAMAQDIRRASSVHPIASVQSEYSLLERGVEAEVLDVCEELGVGFLPYAPLVRGMLAGSLTPDRVLDETDSRARDTLFPRVGPANLAANVELADAVRTTAQSHAATMAQVALAWLLASRPFVVPIPGAKRARHVEDNAGAAELVLTDEELATLDGLSVRVVGERYGSERETPGWVSPPLPVR